MENCTFFRQQRRIIKLEREKKKMSEILRENRKITKFSKERPAEHLYYRYFFSLLPAPCARLLMTASSFSLPIHILSSTVAKIYGSITQCFRFFYFFLSLARPHPTNSSAYTDDNCWQLDLKMRWNGYTNVTCIYMNGLVDGLANITHTIRHFVVRLMRNNIMFIYIYIILGR